MMRKFAALRRFRYLYCLLFLSIALFAVTVVVFPVIMNWVYPSLPIIIFGCIGTYSNVQFYRNKEENKPPTNAVG